MGIPIKQRVGLLTRVCETQVVVWDFWTINSMSVCYQQYIYPPDIYHIVKLVMFEAGDTFKKKALHVWYCWKKSCTTWDVENPVMG